jgi:HSP20 family protein
MPSMTDTTEPRDRSTPDLGGDVPVQWVPVNVWKTDHALVVVAAMPGVADEDVTVNLSDGVLTLEADLRTAAPKEYLVQEWFYGSYRRDLEVGPDYGEPVTVSLGNGLLAVSIGRLGAPAGR